MKYELELTRLEIDYVIMRLREVDPGYADNPNYVASKIEEQIGRNVHDNPRRMHAYTLKVSDNQ